MFPIDPRTAVGWRQEKLCSSIVRRLMRADNVVTLDGLRRRRAEILVLARNRRARRIAVFGSVARGEACPGSDLDLLVDFEPGASLVDHIGLCQDLEKLLGVTVDVVLRRALTPRDGCIRAEAVEL
jgi:predicted nucleotidyltransferase